MEKLTMEKLKEVIYYDHLTGLFYWKKHMGSRARKGNVTGTQNKEGYIQIMVNRKIYYGHRLAWLYVHGYFPENDVDHIDRIRNHNWISNLRESSRQCNIRNTGNHKTNTSGVKGVYWCKESEKIKKGKWNAKMSINRKTKNLGYYEDFEEAVCARLAGEQCLNWEGCNSNSPAYQYVSNMLKVK